MTEEVKLKIYDFIDKKLCEYQDKRYGYNGVTYNIGVTDGLIMVKEFISRIK